MIVSLHQLRCFWLGSSSDVDAAATEFLRQLVLRLEAAEAVSRHVGIAPGYAPEQLRPDSKGHAWLKKRLGEIPAWLSQANFDGAPENAQKANPNHDPFLAVVYSADRERQSGGYLRVIVGRDYIIFDWCAYTSCHPEDVAAGYESLSRTLGPFRGDDHALFEATLRQAGGDAAELSAFEKFINDNRKCRHPAGPIVDTFVFGSCNGKWCLDSEKRDRRTIYDGAVWHASAVGADKAEDGLLREHLKVTGLLPHLAALMACEAKLNYEWCVLQKDYGELSGRSAIDAATRELVKSLLTTCERNFTHFEALATEVFSGQSLWVQRAVARLGLQLGQTRHLCDALAAKRPTVDPPPLVKPLRCLVLMDFDSSKDFYTGILEPILGEMGVKCERIDLDPSGSDIAKKFVRAVEDADFVLADLTNPKAKHTVAYELGAVHSRRGKLTILISKDQNHGIFYLQLQHVIHYEDSHKGYAELRKELRPRVEAIRNGRYTPDGPFESHLRGASGVADSG